MKKVPFKTLYQIQNGFLTIITTLIDHIFPVPPSVSRIHTLTVSDIALIEPYAYLSRRKVQGDPLTIPHGIQAILRYRTPFVTELIFELKYYKNHAAAHVLSLILEPYIIEMCGYVPPVTPVIITYIPASKHRKRTYGYCQLTLVCAYLAKRISYIHNTTHVYSLQIHNNLLFETSDHREQKTLDRYERLAYAYKRFKVRTEMASLVHNAYVIVIDDVVTTGATCIAARDALFEAGAYHVSCIALAH